MVQKLELQFLPGSFAVAKFRPNHEVPMALLQADFFALTKTDEELSLVCRTEDLPPGGEVEAGWVCLKVLGPLDFALTGILAGLAKVLAEAEISIFAISTFDTDYLLVEEANKTQATAALQSAGYLVRQA